jgi:hypothetical protein
VADGERGRERGGAELGTGHGHGELDQEPGRYQGRGGGGGGGGLGLDNDLEAPGDTGVGAGKARVGQPQLAGVDALPSSGVADVEASLGAGGKGPIKVLKQVARETIDRSTAGSKDEGPDTPALLALAPGDSQGGCKEQQQHRDEHERATDEKMNQCFESDSWSGNRT